MTAIPLLLDKLDLQDKIITIDAIGTQRSICQQIVLRGGDYVVSLKRNQQALFNDVQLYFEKAYLIEKKR